MSFSEYDVTRRTRKGNFLKQIDQLIDWNLIEKAIAAHYAPVSDAAGRPAYSGLLLFKMLLVGIWNGGLSDESVEDMANMYPLSVSWTKWPDCLRDRFGSSLP